MAPSLSTIWLELAKTPATGTGKLMLGPQSAAALNSTGVLEIFLPGTDGAIWHSWQTSPGSYAWSPWNSLNAPPPGIGPELSLVAGDTGGAMQVFVVGRDGAVWAISHHVDDPTAIGAWQSLGAPPGGATATLVLGRSAGSTLTAVQLFVIGLDGAIWTISPDPSTATGWSLWTSLQFAGEGGVLPYAVAANQDGRLELFCIAQDNQIWHAWMEPVSQPASGSPNPSGLASWSNWVPLSAPSGDAPSITPGPLVTTTNASGNIEVYFLDSFGNLWGRSQSTANTQSAWSDWNRLPPPSFSLKQGQAGIQVLSNADGREEILALDPQGRLWHTFNPNVGGAASSMGLLGQWQAWTRLSNLSFASFVTAKNADDRLDLFSCGADLTAVWHLAQTAANDDGFAPPPWTAFPGSARDLVKDGTWFKDSAGRFVLFRGVNFAARTKLPPFVPTIPLTDTVLPTPGTPFPNLPNFEALMQQMKAWGFNVVRFPVIWKGIEPIPNPSGTELLPTGQAYLAVIKDIVDQLFAMGIFVFIDFHQDIAHQFYNGDGFPDWAIQVDQDHEQPSSFDLQDSDWGVRYYDYHQVPISVRNQNNILVRVTLNAFWQNSVSNSLHNLSNFPVQDHLIKTIGQTARFFMEASLGSQVIEEGGGIPMFDAAGGHPAILGYEFFNEPHPVGQGKQNFEQNILPDFYNKALGAVRQTDPNAFVFLEPRMDWTTYPFPEPEYQGGAFVSKGTDIQSFLSFSDPDIQGANKRAVFSFHHYDPWTLFYQQAFNLPDDMENKQKEWPGIYAALVNAATSRAMIPFLTEFGGSHDWTYSTDLRPEVYGTQIRAYLDLAFQQIERKLLNATLWVYDLYATKSRKDNWNFENFSLLGPGAVPREIDIVVRPYPLRSSAKPVLLSFDIESKHCAIILEGEPVDAPSVIYVPTVVQYQQGFEVRATSAGVQWDEADQHLLWFPDRNKSLNQIIICPPGKFDASALPVEARRPGVFQSTQLVATFPGSNVGTTP